MEIQNQKVKTYFEDKAKEFDDIYNDNGSLGKKLANKLFREGMRQRFNWTLKSCLELRNTKKAKTVLDIGCGAGRFAFPLEKMGFDFLGIDYSAEMIRMANVYLESYKKRMGSVPRIKFEAKNFMKDFDKNKKYDITIAMGVFDYVKHPADFIAKMKHITKDAMILSFPKRYTPQMPIRKMWLALRHCPVYFYTKNEVIKILKKAGVNKCAIGDVSAGYQVYAEISSDNA